MGLVFSASGIGGSVFNVLVGKMISQYGWSTSMLIQAGVIIVCGIPAALFIVEKPETKNQVAYGANTVNSSQVSSNANDGVTVGEAIKSPSFYLTFIGALLISMAIQLILYSAPNHLGDTNFTPTVAANAMAGVFAVNAVAKILLGRLNDRRGIWSVLITNMVAIFIAVTSLNIIDSAAVLYIFPIFFGIALAVLAVPLPLFIQYVFGNKSYSSLMGLMMSALAVGAAIGPPLGNIINEQLGSYVPAFWGVMVLSLVAFATFALAGFLRPIKKMLPVYS